MDYLSDLEITPFPKLHKRVEILTTKKPIDFFLTLLNLLICYDIACV